MVVIALVLTLAAGVALLLLSDKPGTQTPSDTATGSVLTDDEPDAGVQAADTEAAAILAARQRVADAELALEMAVAQRKAAEADIQTAEREVEELERWVAEIEARGEDPVDYADEGLEKLQPAFFAYQDASQRLELAEEMEVTATEELTLAKAALSAALAKEGKQKQERPRSKNEHGH
ncbi:MAG: hypothetical protein QNJ11_03345 [Woeseiaceae bacterium]|nr:hypothetical protein [Woeseiaceae bacterium]